MNGCVGRFPWLPLGIRRGVQTFIEVCQALEEIAAGKLYREKGFSTFEEYCREVWGFARQTAYNYLKAAEVAGNVPMSVQNLPSFSQAVELSVLTPEQQREVAENVQLTAQNRPSLTQAVELSVLTPEQLPLEH